MPVHHARVLLSLLLFVTLAADGPALAAPGTPTNPASISLDALPPCDFGADSAVPDLVVGAVVLDFETGFGCAQNLDQSFPIASVPKLFVSAAYHDQVVRGYLSPAATMRFDDSYLMGGSGDCLTDADLGRDVALSELEQIMIDCSDNAATWMLMDRLSWGAVNFYVDGLGIPGIGEVVPYALVDQMKLASIDPRWWDVPTAMASRYMRRRQTDGLDAYFDTIPDYSREQMRQANQTYFDTSTYNTATPRAMADFLILMRERLLGDPFSPEAQVAARLFSTMLLTPRLYSAQSLPGTVYVGAKNGFDTGLVAEVNVVLDDLANYNRTPHAIALIFTRQTDVTGSDVQRPRQTEGPLNRLLRDLSPLVRDLLYPGYTVPPVEPLWSLGLLRFGSEDAINACWRDYRLSDYDESLVDAFSGCLASLPQQPAVRAGEDLYLGLVMTGLRYEDTRLTLIYTAPDGQVRSYQTRAQLRDRVGVNWYHPVDQAGIWTVDVYVNLTRAGSYSVQVGA